MEKRRREERERVKIGKRSTRGSHEKRTWEGEEQRQEKKRGRRGKKGRDRRATVRAEWC